MTIFYMNASVVSSQIMSEFAPSLKQYIGSEELNGPEFLNLRLRNEHLLEDGDGVQG